MYLNETQAIVRPSYVGRHEGRWEAKEQKGELMDNIIIGECEISRFKLKTSGFGAVWNNTVDSIILKAEADRKWLNILFILICS